jgi:hypothetical protein
VAGCEAAAEAATPISSLTHAEVAQFAEDGYVVVRDAVPESLLQSADAEIDALTQQHPPRLGHGCLGWSSWSATPDRVPGCDAILRKRVIALGEELVAPHRLDLVDGLIQVAVTVPPWSLCRERGVRVLRRTSGNALAVAELMQLRPPVAITGRRGDVVLAHFLLGHNMGGNMTIHDRRALYYRLATAGHRQWWEQTFLDVWFEYEPVRAAVEASAS